MNNELSWWAASSADPTEVSTRVKGVIVMFSSIIMMVALHIFHITLNPEDVVSLAGEAGTVAGAITTIYGAGLWMVRLFASKRS